MNTNNQICPHCKKTLENENLIICTHCGREIYSMPEVKRKKHNLFSAYGAMFAKMFDFKSRSSRSEYWYAYLANFFVMLVFVIALLSVDYLAGAELSSSGVISPVYKTAFDIINYASVVYSLVVFVPQLSLIVRRLHDTNRSAVFALLLLAAPIGNFFLIALLVQRGTPGPNRYGEA